MKRIIASWTGNRHMALVAVVAGLCFAALFALDACNPPQVYADPPLTKAKLKVSLSPADLAATVFVSNEQNLSPWTVKGIVKNVGGHDYYGAIITGKVQAFRLVTLEQITGSFGPHGRHPKVVTLATLRVFSLKAGESVSLQKVFAVEPAAGTRFQLVISAGDTNPDNDVAQIRYPQ
jgi:hypothetical protein